MTYKRKEIIGDCTLYLGDCLDVMPTLGKVDHIISDPPYEDEIHESNKKNRKLRKDKGQEFKKFGFSGINKIRINFTDYCKISKGWVLLFCLAEGVKPWEECFRACKIKYDTTMAWIKPDAAPRFNGQGPSRGFECIVTGYSGRGFKKWNAGGKRGVYTHLTNQPDRTGLHPTEKPIPLMREILRDFTNQNETILDPFMGSGTTGVACVKLGRKFIGIELNEKYFDIACKRIEEAYRQPDMFIDPPKKPVQGDLL